MILQCTLHNKQDNSFGLLPLLGVVIVGFFVVVVFVCALALSPVLCKKNKSTQTSVVCILRRTAILCSFWILSLRFLNGKLMDKVP